jgi:hypothetical protein
MLPVTICVLTYGDYLPLAVRAIDSIRFHCDRSLYSLVIGANGVSTETRLYLNRLLSLGEVDRVHFSDVNVNKCRMMRRMFSDIDTEFIWWFDDDSFVTDPSALETWLTLARSAPETTVIWGHQFYFGSEGDFSCDMEATEFVRTARWFRGLPPPSWQTGSKAGSEDDGCGSGDGRWFFITGGCWLVRTAALVALGWPDPRLVKRWDDVLLGEAVRQQGWSMQDIGPLGVVINDSPRRGVGEDEALMIRDPGFEPMWDDIPPTSYNGVSTV